MGHSLSASYRVLTSSGPETNRLETLLECVVAHGRNRLLRRLGLDTPSQIFQMTTAGHLAEALAHFANNYKRAAQTYENVYALSRKLSNLARPLLHQDLCSTASLLSILMTFSDLWGNHHLDIRSIFSQVTNRQMDPSRKEHLELRLAHLGRYVPAAKRLLKYARQFPIFLSVRVRPVYVAPLNLSPYTKGIPAVSATGILNRHIHRSKDVKNQEVTSALQQVLHRRPKKSLAAWQKDIRDQVVHYQSLGGYRVHAEIQLVMEYARQDDVKHPPRVLKSSKSACFLCNMFIKIHGKWYTPKTHGKLYSRWMFPALDGLGLAKKRRREMADVVARFEKAIEQEILRVAVEGANRLNNPRESDIFSLAASTAHSASASGSTTTEIADEPHDGLFKSEIAGVDAKEGMAKGRLSMASSTTSLEETSSLSTPSEAGNGPRSREDLHNADPLASPITPQTPTLPTRQTSKFDTLPKEHPHEIAQSVSRDDFAATPTVNLEPGLSYPWLFTQGRSAIRFHTTSIHLEVSQAEAASIAARSSLNSPDQKGCHIGLTATWLDSDKGKEILMQYRDSIVELQGEWWKLEPEEGILFGVSGLLFRNGEHVVQLKASYIQTEEG